MTLVDGDGVEQRFNSGDAAYVPMGAPCGWKSSEPVRKFDAIFEPTV